MPQISLTDFIDIVFKSGMPKAHKVEAVKNRPDYEPAFDFYKQIRDKIVDIHSLNLKKGEFNNFIEKVTDPKKLKHYPSIMEGYKKWWGRKDLQWFNPQRAVFNAHNIDVIINPEIGLKVNGKKHIIKLYFKEDPLSKNRIGIVNFLLEMSLQDKIIEERLGILDVRNSKLHVLEGNTDKTMGAILDSELAYIENLWGQI